MPPHILRVSNGGRSFALEQHLTKPERRYTWQGTGQYAVTDLAEAVLAMAPKWSSLLPSPVASRGHFAFSRQGKTLVFEPIDMRFGRSTLSGRINWTSPDGEGTRPQLSGEVALDRLDVATVLTPLIKRSGQASQPAEGDDETLWPDLPFELKAASLADGNLKLSVRRLEIRPDFNLSNASMTVTAKDGGFAVTNLAAKLFGGEVKGRARLNPAQAGVSIDSRLELTNLSLDRIVSSALRKRTTGTLSGEISAAGQALSPRALMTALRGNGRVKRYRIHAFPAWTHAHSRKSPTTLFWDIPRSAISAPILPRPRPTDRSKSVILQQPFLCQMALCKSRILPLTPTGHAPSTKRPSMSCNFRSTANGRSIRRLIVL